MAELVPTILVFLFGLLVLFWAQEDLNDREARWFWLGVLAHLASYALLMKMQWGLGIDASDMVRYVYTGQLIADDMRADFFGVLTQSLLSFFQQPSGLNVPLPGAGSTGTMTVLTGWVCFVIGDSLLAVNAVFMIASVLGKLAMYKGLRESFPQAIWDRIGWVAFLVPSVVFWTSGVVKEAVAMIGVGLMVQAISRIRGLISPIELARLLLGAAMVALIKPYVLFVLVGALGVLFYFRWASREGQVVQVRPLVLVSLSVISAFAIIGLGYVFPSFAIDQLAEEAAYRQNFAYKTQAHSSYFIGDPTQNSLIGQVAYMPLGVITTWYRPFFFEARSVMALVSALEGSLFLLATILVVIRQDPLTLWRSMSRWPWLPFSMAFALVFGAVVGMVTSNFGTMVRYRVPLLPFLSLVLAVWSIKTEDLLVLLKEAPDEVDDTGLRPGTSPQRQGQ